MKKKLQIFISSTFSDLQIERQSAVEAVLRAGHIPAGMELFSAGNESQLEIIKRWIDESDVYMLILGGRYGSIEKESGLSYTELEYRYALKNNKPVFAIIVSDDLLKNKVKEHGTDVIERKQIEKYDLFKELVLSKICRFFNNDNEIKLSIFESIIDIQSRFHLNGWVRAEEIPDISSILKQLTILQEENLKLNKALTADTNRTNKLTFGGFSYDDLLDILKNKKITIPKSVSQMEKDYDQTYLDLFLANSGVFNAGINNLFSASESEQILYKVASEMMAYGLIEQKTEKQGQVTYSMLRSSDEGKRLLAEIDLKLIRAKAANKKPKKQDPIV